MKYTKPALTVEQQADQLITRGLIADRPLLIDRLRVVSYYRLSAYWHPFRKPDPQTRGQLLNDLEQGTKFETIWDRYVFDRHLRLLVMDAIERIEVAVRTAIAYHHSLAHGPFAYATDPDSLPGIDKHALNSLIGSIQRERQRSKETFIKHFKEKYGSDHANLPVWMAIEIMSFGSVLTMYRGCAPPIQKSIAQQFGVQDAVFTSWLHAIQTTRNICAHHGRLWNRVLGVKPKVPRERHDDRWHTPIAVTNSKIFGMLSVCKCCMERVAPQSDWPCRVRTLVTGTPNIPLIEMGFPDNWLDCPIWNPGIKSDSGRTDRKPQP